MATIIIERVRVVADDGTVVNVTKISDDTKDTWLVESGGINYPVEGYDRALTEAEALAAQLSPVKSAQVTLDTATVAAKSYADGKRDEAETATAEVVVP